MAYGDGTFRSRALSLLRPSLTSAHHSYADVNLPNGSKKSTDAQLNEKQSQNTAPNEIAKTQPYQSVHGNTVIHNREAQRIVRTIPAWVHTLDEDDDNLFATAQCLPHIPPEILTAQHNSSPSTKFRLRPETSPGRVYDHQREWTPPLPTRTVAETGSRWRAFADASAYPALSAEGGQKVTEEWLVQNGADYSRPWLARDGDGEDPEKGPARMHMFKAKRRVWYVRAQRTILRNPLLPMIIRMNVWFFSAIALGLAASIRHLTDNPDNSLKQTPSTNMAIIVDAVAMLYLLYITYDEYSGKPLGLRPARAKMRLIFLDLFFIVFDSANLSLAFEASRGPICTVRTPGTDEICSQQKGLASVLLIALVAWLLAFSISVMRLIERVTGR